MELELAGHGHFAMTTVYLSTYSSKGLLVAAMRSKEEKFELYYDEYKSLQKEQESKSLNESLKKAGLKKPPGNSQTPKK